MIFLLVGNVFASNIKVWHDPSFKIFELKKIFVLLNVELKAGVQLLPERELMKQLEDWVISGIRSATKNNNIIVKPIGKVIQEMKIEYGEEVPPVDLFFQRANDMGYDAVIKVNIVQCFTTEHIQGQTINYTTYNNAYIKNNKGWVTGTVSIPQNQAIVIPDRDVTYLYTACVPQIFLTDNYVGDYKVIVTYEIYKYYRGGEVIKVVENIIKASMKNLFPSDKLSKGKSYFKDKDNSIVKNNNFVSLKRRAELGEVEAQFKLGSMYEKGRGLKSDYKMALYWYKKAAEGGNAGAQNQLGSMYESGRGVKKDYKKAVEWYMKAAKQGLAVAQSNLASKYYYGYGVRQSNEQALYWLKLGAEGGYAQAQNNLGYMYANGIGTEKDINQAIYWWKRAAQQGEKQAQKVLQELGIREDEN